jgi:hypothetical protein
MLACDFGLDVLTAMTLAWRVLAAAGLAGFVELRLPLTTQPRTDHTRYAHAPSVLYPIRTVPISATACARFRHSRGTTGLRSNWKELA